MFITEADYNVVVGDAALKVISQSSPETIENAQAEAIEEMAGYLRPTYDCDKIFAAEGTERNRQVVMYAVDIALYNMVSAMPQRMGYDIRKERYERALSWLQDVQKGDIVPNLPVPTDEEGIQTNLPFSYGSHKQLKNQW